MSGFGALLYLEGRTLRAQLRLLAQARGRLAVYLLVAVYIVFILTRSRRGMPHFGHAATIYALALWLLGLGIAAIGGQRRLLARPADLALVVPSAIPPDRIVVWTLVRQAVTQLRFLIVVAVFWVPQMAASGDVGWGSLLYLVGLTLIAAMAIRYILLGLGRWGDYIRYALLAAFALLALRAGLGLGQGGLAGLAAVCDPIWPLALTALALHGNALALAALGVAALLVLGAMIALAPSTVRLGVDWGALPVLAGRRGIGWRAALVSSRGPGAAAGRRRFRRRDWPGQGGMALLGVEFARLYRTMLPLWLPLIALGWVVAGIAGHLAVGRGMPWQVLPGLLAYMMVLTGAAALSVTFGQVLSSPLWAQTPGLLGTKLMAWFLPAALVSGLGWGGVATGWLIGAGQAAIAVWSLPLALSLMLLSRAVALLAWAVMPNAIDQRTVAVWLRLLFTVLTAAIAAAFFAGAYALLGLAAGAIAGCLAATGEAYLCLQLSEMRIAAMDFVRPSAGRA